MLREAAPVLCEAVQELEVAAIHDVAGQCRPDISFISHFWGMPAAGRQPAAQCGHKG
jgi:hypothetical protein